MWFEGLASLVLNRLTRPPRRTPPAGVIIGRTTGPERSDVTFPDRHRTQHLVVVGKTGFGKTHFLEVLTTQLAERGEGFAFFDFHGDASSSLIRRLLALPDAQERVVVLDPSDLIRSPAINILESGATEAERFRKVAELSSILRQRWGVDSFGARTEELLRNSLYTLANGGRTLGDFPKFLTNTTFRGALTARVEHPDIREYWRDRYEPLSEAMKAAFREPLLNRVTAFLTEPGARHLLAQRESTIDIAEVMLRQQWLIIRLPKGRLREHAHTIGNLLFAQLQFAVMAREALPQRDRQTFTLVCDEVQNLAENDLGSLIAEGRKFGISIVTANQFWEQMPRELRGALLSAASHMCFQLSHADAGILGPELDNERRSRLTSALATLHRGEAIGRFGTTGLQTFRVSPLPQAPALDAEAREAILNRVTRLRTDIERDLREPPLSGAPTPDVTGPGIPPVREGQHDW